jgi:hypothetical protein
MPRMLIASYIFFQQTALLEMAESKKKETSIMHTHRGP